VTSQGHSRTAFRRALERGNVVVAEIEAREVGRLDLREALELTALIAVHDRLRFDRYRVRCLHRCPSALVALGGPRHDEALALLCAVIT
jgi:hypothetical protein